MADMLSIGSAASNAFKRAIEVTSHNVANIGTEGYNRQRAELLSNAPNYVGPAFLGGGSRVDSINRIYADYIQSQLVSAGSGKARFSEQLSLSKQLEGVIASNDEGLQQSMQNLFDSFQSLANDPVTGTNRQLVMDEASNLESLIGNMTKVLSDTQEQVNSQVEDMVSEVNSRLDTIQKINTQVSVALSNGTQPPNDLLDRRDQAILELGEYMDIKTFPQENGRIDIHTGNGRYPLISDNTVTNLKAAQSEFRDDNRIEVYMTIGGQEVVISDQITQGQLGGVLDFRNNMLDDSVDELGLTLNGMVASMNWQHYQGFDLNGDAGTDIYKSLTMNAVHSTKNAGTEDGTNIAVSFKPNIDVLPGFNGAPPYTPATQPTTFADKEAFLDLANQKIGEFEPRQYQVRTDGAGNFSFFDHKTGEALTPTVIQAPAAGFGGIYELDGLNFDFSAVADATTVASDKFLVKPHQEIISNFERSLKNSDQLATRGQSPVFFDAAMDTGPVDGYIDIPEFNAGIAGTGGASVVVGEFDTYFGLTNYATNFDLDSDGLLNNAEYNSAISSGKQEMLDVSTPSAGALGDNVNFANMANLQSKKILYSDDSGRPSETLLGGYSTMATNVGVYVRSTDIQLSAQTNVFDQVTDRRESLSGVSLDEEAANLMKFQQAYQASAQIMQTSQTLFQTLLGVFR